MRRAKLKGETYVGFPRCVRYCLDVSLVKSEVEIDYGRVIPRGLESLPEKGTGLLTLLSNASGGSVSDFIDKWADAFFLPESVGDDPRLAYLLGKHAN